MKGGMMKESRSKIAVAAAIAVALLAPAARATDLFTPLIFVGSDDEFFCTALNVDTSPRSIEVEVINITNVVVAHSGPFTISPGGTNAASAGGNANLYCHFKVDGGGKRYRASGCLDPKNGGLAMSFRDCVSAQ